jgi:hypothetical protein
VIDFTKKKSLQIELERLESERITNLKRARNILRAEFILPVIVAILSMFSRNLAWWGILCSLFLAGLLVILGHFKKVEREHFRVSETIALLFNAGFFAIYFIFIILRFIFKI